MRHFGFLFAGSLILATSFASATTELLPEFRYIPEGWLSAPVVTEMDSVWASAGFQERGKNYWITGGPPNASNPYWERFNPESPLFQGWLGVYVVRHFEFAADWDNPSLETLHRSARRFEDLSISDQNAWLKAYGVRDPETNSVEGSLKVSEWRNGYFRISSLMLTQSDLGSEKSIFPFHPPYAMHSTLIQPYQEILLHVQGLMKFDKSTQRFVGIYTALPEYALLDGRKKFPRPTLQWDLLRAAEGVTFRDVSFSQ